MAADVKIDIAAEFTGKKAFKQAETSTDKLSKSVKKLAGTLGLAFGTTAVLAYAKASVKAAAADQKAQQQLALALKNVGLERDAASAEGFIQRLQSEFGIIDDKLRPAYQALAVATKDTAETQRLLNLALDISAATGKDLGSITSALSRAYLGNNTALSRLGVGISKADLKTKSFYEITTQLADTFKGSATQAANTFQGSMDKLAVASANVQEIIGTGLIDALKALGDDNSVDNLAASMQNAAEYTADVIRGIGVLLGELKKLPGVSGLNLGMIPILGTYLEALRAKGQASQISPKPFTTPMTISGQTQVQQQAKITKLTKDQAAAQAKITKDKKLQQAIDKANLALGKGTEIFDLDQIQVAAALTNQAEQLGKATSASQALQIANDTARLNVKRSILALEDAIASKDEASIIAATNKLNADLKVLGALTGQSVKLSDIKSILESLKPADLINLANLDAAIAKMMELLKLQGTKKTETATQTATRALTEFEKFVDRMPVSTSTADLFADLKSDENWWKENGPAFLGYEPFIGAKIPTTMPETSGGSGVGLGNTGTGRQIPIQAGVNITVNTGIGDPEAIARAVEDVVRQSYQRGTSSTGLLAV